MGALVASLFAKREPWLKMRALTSLFHPHTNRYEEWKKSEEDFTEAGNSNTNTFVGDDVTGAGGIGWFNVQAEAGAKSETNPDWLQYAFECRCDCECEWSTGNIVAAIFMCIAAACIALDAFLKLDYRIEKMVDVATELNHIGWEFTSLSGDFKQYGTHQDAFIKFAAKVEVSIGKIPATWLPDDEVFEEVR